jgi:alpha-N-arabinofuranosidase
MYTVHHDATLVPADLQSSDYTFDPEKIPAVSVSASRDADNRIHVSLCNLNPRAPAEVLCELQGERAKKISGRVLTAPEMTAHNTFERTEAVRPVEFNAFKMTSTGFNTTLPSKSVVVLELE